MKRVLALIIALVLPCGMIFSQKKDTYRVRTVVIDPGHGGAKPGARGSRSYEKDITLAVAKKFGKLIEDNYPDVKVIYTRTNDADISLAERSHIANRNKADLFVSIHANSHPTSSPTGVETFVMGLSESKANLEVARKENADILLEADYKNNADYSGFDPNSPESYVMLAMFQNSFIDKSLNFAQAIQTQYKQNLRTINRGVKQAELYVLYKTSMPSVLTEIGFISNPTEEAFMLSEEGQAKIAVCLFNAFMTYKATEEGSNRPANPVFNIKGYVSPEAEKAGRGTETEKTVVEEVAPASEPEAVQSVPQTEEKAETLVVTLLTEEEPQEQRGEPEPVQQPEPAITERQSNVTTPYEKPTPQVALPQVETAETNPTATPKAKESVAPPKNTAEADDAQYYTVQFLVAPTQYGVGSSQLDGITDFEASRKGQSYVYTSGRFRTFKEASQYCEQLHRTTSFKDAWVFQVRKSPQAVAETTTAESNVVAQPSAVAISYRVQFCTATREMKAGDPDLHGIRDFRCAASGKVYVYTAGDYTTVQKARERCRQIQQSTPFRDAFVIAIHNGQRISLERAAQLERQSK